MNNFQTILTAVFLAFFVFAVLIFSGLIKLPSSGSVNSGISGKITVWGTLPSSEVSDLFDSLSATDASFSVKYVEQQKSNYDQSLVEAFANDQGPDLYILTPDMILKNDNFIYKIPYTTLSEKSFKDSFIDGSDILLTKDGIYGYPLTVDPLVLYYNKDILSNEGILSPPATWDQLFDLGGKITKKKNDGSVTQAMIALGRYENVSHFKDILSLLLLQGGNPIVARTDTGYRLAIKDTSSNDSFPFETIVKFFLEFSDPSKDIYTWNRSLPSSIDMFTSGKLAFYVGYASELFKIEGVNPNLSFDVAMIPQTKGSNLKRTYGKMETLVVSKKSPNIASALGVASLITSESFTKELGIRTSLPTAQRALLADKPTDPYALSFSDAVIVSRSWLDPDKNKTDTIFKEMLQNSLSNKFSVSESIGKAYDQIDLLIKK